MQTIFITGAEGFVGTVLTQHLRQRGYRVVAGVRNRARKLAYERRFGKAIVCDVSDAINVARAVASVKPDGVVHLAGYTHTHDTNEQPLEAYQSIVSGWANLLDAVRRTVPRARVLLISACDVYGRAGHQPVREDAPLAPVSTFGALKVTAESVARTFSEKYCLNLSVARPFHYTGPGQPDTFFYGSVARRLANWDLETDGDELALPDLRCRRDLLHVHDVVDAYERLLHDGQPNQTYNVCSGEARTCAEIVQVMAQSLRLPLRLVDAPSSADDEFVDIFWGDNTKLRSELGWQPTHTADGALQELVRSYYRQPVPPPPVPVAV